MGIPPQKAHMDKQAFFWKVIAGELPPPNAAATLGIAFKSIDADQGCVEVEFQARSEFTNPAGYIQGGFLAAMLDDTMGPALAATLSAGEFAPTLDLHVSFQKPAQVGVIQGKGRILQRRKEICFLSAELYQHGALVASASATAIVRAMKP